MIGEHTDYNEGWVLPGASDLHLLFAAVPDHQPAIRIRADRFAEEVTLDLAGSPIRFDHWSRFPAAVIQTARAYNLPLTGLHILFGGTLPMGVGMSSSSALTCGLVYLMNHQFNWQLPNSKLIELARESEHRTGVRGGVMDQFAILNSIPGHVQLLDCRTLVFRQIQLPTEGPSWFILDSGVHHNLVKSPYNQRREACERIVEEGRLMGLTIKSLRDLDDYQLGRISESASHTDVEKARFVLDENARVHQMVEAFTTNNWTLAGQLLYQSHQGLRHQYQVSCPELDTIVDTLSNLPGIYGARLMGAGFGGSVLVLANPDGIEKTWTIVQDVYDQQHKKYFTPYPVRLDQGVHILDEEHLNNYLHE